MTKDELARAARYASLLCTVEAAADEGREGGEEGVEWREKDKGGGEGREGGSGAGRVGREEWGGERREWGGKSVRGVKGGE